MYFLNKRIGGSLFLFQVLLALFLELLFQIEGLVHHGVGDHFGDEDHEREAEQRAPEQRDGQKQDHGHPVDRLHQRHEQRAGRVAQAEEQAVFQQARKGHVHEHQLAEQKGEAHAGERDVQPQKARADHADARAGGQHKHCREDLAGNEDAQQRAGHKARFPVALERALVGVPPETRLVAQSAQHRVVQACVAGACQHAAQKPRQHRDGQVVRHDAEAHEERTGRKAQRAQQICLEQAAHVAPEHLEEAARALFSGRVFGHARPRPVKVAIEKSHDLLPCGERPTPARIFFIFFYL